jgi:hypothetical protein
VAAVLIAAAVPAALVLGDDDPRGRVVPTATPETTVMASVSASPAATKTASPEPTPTATATPRRTPSPTDPSPKRGDDLPLALDAVYDVPSQVGRWSPFKDATLGAARKAFGSEDVATTEPDAEYLCVVEWRDVGLTVNFANLGGEDPCAPDTGYAGTIEIDGEVSDRWRTLSGLRPGMPERAIAKLYDDARKTPEGDWWLVTATSQIGTRDEYAPIVATVEDGVVSGFELTVGAAGD